MSKEFFISRMGFSAPTQADQEKLRRELAAVDEAIAELDAGLYIPGEEIEAWVDSWDTENELPPPQPRRRS